MQDVLIHFLPGAWAGLLQRLPTGRVQQQLPQ